jgi:hypothetical protein
MIFFFQSEACLAALKPVNRDELVSVLVQVLLMNY